MQPVETVRSVATRLEHYFDWYVRVDPDVPAEAVQLLSRFNSLVFGPSNPAGARVLLEQSRGFALGSPWEEMRAALRELAHG